MGLEAQKRGEISKFAQMEAEKYRVQNIELREQLEMLRSERDLLLKENWKLRYRVIPSKSGALTGLQMKLSSVESALKIVARGGCCRVCELECADKGRTAACSAFRWNGRGE